MARKSNLSCALGAPSNSEINWYKNSDGTDWMFLILLQLTTLTGIFIHFTRLLDWALTTYILYVVHLMVVIPMLVVEVPFSKWAHLAFRPVVLFLTNVKEQ